MSRTTRSIRKRRRKTTTRRDKFFMWLGGMFGAVLTKTDSVLPSYVFEPEPVIRHPDFDYISLFEVATTSWLLRRAFRAIIQECVRNRWKIEPRFKFKCTNKECGKEFLKTPKDEKCDSCNTKLRKPEEGQARLFEKLLKKPNIDYNFDDFVRSSLFYDLALDDWYWYVRYKYSPKKDEKGKIIIQNRKAVYEKVPFEIYVEDARFIFPVADRYGHLGNYEYFCPSCYDKAEKDLVENLKGQSKEDRDNAKCSQCGGPVVQTCYVQEIGGQVTARYGRDEIIHGSSSRVVPSLFGNSKIVTVWKLVMTVMAMDDYNWEVYSEGKVGSILGFPGEDQTEVQARKKRIQQELRKLDTRDIQTGRRRTSKKIRTMMIGMKKGVSPVRIPIMETLKDMQSLEFYKIYGDAIGGVYGVTPEFVSVTTPYSGTKLKIDVQNRTTQDHQSNFGDLFNDELLMLFGITDWVLAFNEVETRDMLRVVQVEHTKAAAALTYLRGGFKVTIDEMGKLTAYGDGKLPELGGPGSRMGERPREMEGKPRGFNEGEPTRTEGERLELGLPRIPISWYSATEIRVWDRIYAINQDQNELYVMMNRKEIDKTRFLDSHSDYVIGELLRLVLRYVGIKLTGEKGFNIDDWTKEALSIVEDARRGFRPDGLIQLSSFLDSIGKNGLAMKFDDLRRRLVQIHPMPQLVPVDETEIESPSLPPSPLGEMPLPIGAEGAKGAIIQARAPFGIVYEEFTLAESLGKIINWATRESKKRKKGIVIHEALAKAETVIDKSYKELMDRATKHAQRRTKKENIILSPEQLTRLEVFKTNSLDDFRKILEDSLKGR